MSLVGKLRGLWDAKIGALAGPQEPSPFYFTVVAGTDTGRVRAGNEDSVLALPVGIEEPGKTVSALAVLADGMGGTNAGEVASALACKTIERSFLDAARSSDPGQALMEALRLANRAIFAQAQRAPEMRGMGTTCVTLALRGAEAWMAYVGDSRLYLARSGTLYRMSEDHTVVFEMVKRGMLTPEAARNHPDRNVRSRALGTKEQVEVSRWETSFALQDGDKFLLCSDGLHDLVPDELILEALMQARPEAAVARLIAEANARGGFDNISAIVVEVQANQAPGPGGPAATEAAPMTSVPITREIVLDSSQPMEPGQGAGAAPPPENGPPTKA